ncbi:hypothetical protein CYMTET_50899 [Cymbomonas tetramitiformis]|uniref:Protein kinase domain-containing protein n=1 Tax=Cymbomonas tetramitiformis TaxID=36881 RepID=A0AAE0ESC8_9CHLO|nr:hypothetical protein CYMTET_50899 [Cymbomonas tetramitiformis]
MRLAASAESPSFCNPTVFPLSHFQNSSHGRHATARNFRGTKVSTKSQLHLQTEARDCHHQDKREDGGEEDIPTDACSFSRPRPGEHSRRVLALQAASLLGSISISSSSKSHPLGDLSNRTLLPGDGAGKAWREVDPSESSLADLLPDLRDGTRVLKYEERLGAGSYKEVWRVSINGFPYAMSSQRFSNANLKRRRSSARHAQAELNMAEYLHTAQANWCEQVSSGCECLNYFEVVLHWWVQDRAMQVGVDGALHPAVHTSQNIPGRSATSVWLYALKPLYDFDLRDFQNAVGGGANITAPRMQQTVQGSQATVDDSKGSDSERQAWDISLHWKSYKSMRNQPSTALRLVGELLQVGCLLQQAEVVHADIKPANIMIKDGHAVLIDFGYAQQGMFMPWENQFTKLVLCTTCLSEKKICFRPPQSTSSINTYELL